MDDCYQVGDVIEHTGLPGFRMRVREVGDCADEIRPESHPRYKVIDPEGCEDWLCAYDARRVSS